MCFLAYLCEAHLTKRLREKKVNLESPAIAQGDVKNRPLTVEVFTENRNVVVQNESVCVKYLILHT